MKHGGSAFPALNFIIPSDLEKKHVARLGESQGMTLRDYFAAKAMQGYIARHSERLESFDEVCELSYRFSDAMLKEREK